MKQIYIFSLAALLSALIISCERVDHAANQKVTYYAVISLEGGSTIAHQVGTPWAEPGYSATFLGEDVTDQIVVDDPVDGDESGVYIISYSFVNPDGFVRSASRTVVVYDVANAGTADISGSYSTTSVITYRAGTGELIRDWNGQFDFSYSQQITAGPATGLFYVQDLMVGFYQYFYNGGYGADYAYKAFILLNADNSVSLLNGDEIDPWEDPIYGDEEASYYDPSTETLVLEWNYGGTAIYRSTYTK